MSGKVRNQSEVVASLNRMSIGLLILVVIFFLLAAFFAYASQRALEQKHDLTMNAIRFMDASKLLTAEARAYAADAHEVHYENYWKEVNESKNREKALAAMRVIGITAEEEARIAQMAEISNMLVPLEDEAMKYVREKGDHQSAIDLVFGLEYGADIAKIASIFDEFRTMLDVRQSANVEFYVMLSRIMNVILGLLTLSIIVLQVKNMHYVKNEVIKPIQVLQHEMINISHGNLEANYALKIDETEIGQLTNSVRVTKRELTKYIGDISEQLSKMSAGKLDMDIDIDYIGDFKPIKESLIGILKSLNYIVGEMRESVTDAASAIIQHAKEVTRGSEELAGGATDQARVIEDMSSTVRSLSGEMTTIAESATRSHKDTAASAENLERSSKKMQEMQGAMEAINTASDGIKKITETIAKIGSRTNIVAINAAIEAAKAGDVGRGFAVVADEVRNLAIMCSDASRETDKLLEDTLRSVERGFAITHEITDAMGELISVARESASSVEDIAGRSEQQAQALKDVVSGFEQITNTVQMNAATAKQSAAAAEEMSGQADRLEKIRSLFDRFTLRA